MDEDSEVAQRIVQVENGTATIGTQDFVLFSFCHATLITQEMKDCYLNGSKMASVCWSTGCLFFHSRLRLVCSEGTP